MRKNVFFLLATNTILKTKQVISYFLKRLIMYYRSCATAGQELLHIHDETYFNHSLYNLLELLVMFNT